MLFLTVEKQYLNLTELDSNYGRGAKLFSYYVATAVKLPVNLKITKNPYRSR